MRCSYSYVIHYVDRKFKKKGKRGGGEEKEEKITAFLTHEGHITSPYLYFACSFTNSSHRHQQLLSFGTSAHWHDKQWQYSNCCVFVTIIELYYRAIFVKLLSSMNILPFIVAAAAFVISFFATFCLQFVNCRIYNSIFK